MRTLAELRQALGKAVDELNSDTVISDAKAFKDKETEIENLKGEIDRREKAQALQTGLARPANQQQQRQAEAAAEDITLGSLLFEARSHARREQRSLNYWDCLGIARKGLNTSFDPQKNFRSLGEQLQAIFTHYASKGTSTDGRLVRAPTGAGEVDPTGGGFLVQVDFAATIFMLAHDMGEILSRVNMIPISANSNGLKVPGVDETSRATGSRWGGVSSAWAAEGVAGTESRPKFRLVEFDLKKLISKMTVTDELLQDTTALTSIAATAFSEEVMFMTEDAIWEGTGAGQPLGVLSSPALVTVAKETGQAAGTIVKENIDKMWARCWARSRKNAVWTYNQDAEPQFGALSQVTGTGGMPVFLPPGGLSASPNGTLMGRPMVATEYNAALGTVGDIGLVDFSQYTVVDKNGVQIATSMHVAFDTDEMRFRVTYRVDGKPMWHSAITPFKGSLTKSPFIALAAR
jgi:HK97 family phage major capsid protein